MLSQSNVMGFVPTRDGATARKFYEDMLGLRFISDDDFAVVMESNETTIRITKMKEFTPAPYTILGWRVENIESEVQSLVERGVSFQRYPYFEQSELGIWSAPGGTKVAWFLDPDGNLLSLSQHPE